MILFIEDEPYFMDIYQEWLERCYVVTHVPGPDEALRIVKEEGARIDLVILDIMMSPGEALKDRDTNGGRRTGIVLFDEIRRRLPNVPIVVLTAVTRAEVHAELSAKPNCKFLLKPVTPMELEAAIVDLGVPRKPLTS